MSLLVVVVSSHFIVNNILEVRSFASSPSSERLTRACRVSSGSGFLHRSSLRTISRPMFVVRLLFRGQEAQQLTDLRTQGCCSDATSSSSSVPRRRSRDSSARSSSRSFSLSPCVPLSSLLVRRELMGRAVGNVLHAVQLHDLPGPGSGDQRPFRHPVRAEPRLCLARVPAARLGCFRAVLPCTFSFLLLSLLSPLTPIWTPPRPRPLTPLRRRQR